MLGSVDLARKNKGLPGTCHGFPSHLHFISESSEQNTVLVLKQHSPGNKACLCVTGVPGTRMRSAAYIGHNREVSEIFKHS